MPTFNVARWYLRSVPAIVFGSSISASFIPTQRIRTGTILSCIGQRKLCCQFHLSGQRLVRYSVVTASLYTFRSLCLRYWMCLLCLRSLQFVQQVLLMGGPLYADGSSSPRSIAVRAWYPSAVLRLSFHHHLQERLCPIQWFDRRS